MLNQVQGSQDPLLQSLLSNQFISPELLLSTSPLDGGSSTPTLQASASTKKTSTANLTKTEQVLMAALQMAEKVIFSLAQVITQLSGIIKNNASGSAGSAGTPNTEGPGPSTIDPGKSEPSKTKDKEPTWDSWLSSLASGITILGGTFKSLPKLFSKLPVKFSSAAKTAATGIFDFLNPSKLLTTAKGFFKKFLGF